MDQYALFARRRVMDEPGFLEFEPGLRVEVVEFVFHGFGVAARDGGPGGDRRGGWGNVENRINGQVGEGDGNGCLPAGKNEKANCPAGKDRVEHADLVVVVQEDAHLPADCPDAHLYLGRRPKGGITARQPVEQGIGLPGAQAFQAHLSTAIDGETIIIRTAGGTKDHPVLVLAAAQADIDHGLSIKVAHLRLAAQAGDRKWSRPADG